MAIALLDRHPSIVDMGLATWELEVPRQSPQVLTTQLFSNHAAFEPSAARHSALLLHGYGERQWAVKNWLAASTELGIPAVAAMVNTKQIPADRLNIEAYVYNFAHGAAQILREKDLADPLIPAIGHSMGGAMLGLALRDHSEDFGKTGFAEPICHDTEALKAQIPDDDARRQRTVRRFARVVVGPYAISVSKALPAAFDLIRQISSDSRPYHDHRFKQQLQLAVNLDAGPDVLDHAARGNTIAYVFGTRDPLVKRENVLSSLYMHATNSIDPGRRVGWEGHIFEASTNQQHSHIGWPAGANHLGLLVGMLGLEQYQLAA